jgi:hypothetical protein
MPISLEEDDYDTLTQILVGIMMHWADPEKFADLKKVRVVFPENSWLGNAEQIFAPHAHKLIRKKNA